MLTSKTRAKKLAFSTVYRSKFVVLWSDTALPGWGLEGVTETSQINAYECRTRSCMEAHRETSGQG